MKKYISILLVLLLIVVNTKVYASCNDEELNEWAVSVNPVFKLSKEVEEGKYEYAYFLSISPYREDVKIKVIDGKDYSYGKMFGDFYAVGCYTNLEEKTYTIEIYGGDSSKCKNQLLKTITYTVPRLNRMLKERVCEENPNSEYCVPFTNLTKDMTLEEFEKAVKKDAKEEKSEYHSLNIFIYLLYIIIPFAILTIIYNIKKTNYKKKEGNK